MTYREALSRLVIGVRYLFGVRRDDEEGEMGRLSTPAASSPSPWTKMKAAALEMSWGGLEAGTIVGGILSVDIVNALCYGNLVTQLWSSYNILSLM
jgi:hypothetical protein